MSDFSNEKKAMQELTEKYVNKLTGIWEKIFHPDNCRENLRKLVDHATFFYDELVAESLSRKSFIENEINELKKEADNLKRLLKTDLQLPSYNSDNVPLLIVQSELDKSLEDLREQLRLRKEQICELLLEQEALCEELGKPPLALLADPLPTTREIDNFQRHLESLKEEKVERMNRVSSLRREIKNFLQILELKLSTQHEDYLLNHRQIKLNKETFDDLQRMYDIYGSQVKELQESIQAMRHKLETLWDRLNTSPRTRNKFKGYNDWNQHTYNIFYSELQRCETLKCQNIKLFVQKIRDDIAKLWEKTLKSEIQKSRFSNYNSTCYSDDLLVLHEMELEDLKSFYENNKQIFDLFADRNMLWERMNALEAKASEPGRYNNRGGQLLKEEKERKTIATKLPKIEQQIRDLVKEYEEKEHVPFLVYGDNIIDVMASQWEQKQREKEMLQSARKNGGKTATNSNVKTNFTIRTPLSVKNMSTVSSLRKTPSTISLASNVTSAQKRKLNPAEKYTPLAKRSLMPALNSPSIFLKPTPSKKNVQPIASSAGSSAHKKYDKFGANSKSLKKTKVIATTIRRRSGRYSGSAKKRRSVGKASSTPKVLPKTVGGNCQSDGYSTDYNGDDTYDSFQKCIEPASRSSVIQNTTTSTDSSRSKRMQKILDEENTKLTKLPRPRIINRTPSKNYTSFSNRTRTPTLNSSPAATATTGRKLTTKNLPILI